MPIENDNRLGPNADALRYNDDGEDQSMTSGIDFARAPMQLSLAEGVAVNSAIGASLAELTGIAPSQFRDQSFGGLAPSHLAATDTFAQAAVASTGLYDWREQPSPWPETSAIGLRPGHPEYEFPPQPLPTPEIGDQWPEEDPQPKMPPPLPPTPEPPPPFQPIPPEPAPNLLPPEMPPSEDFCACTLLCVNPGEGTPRPCTIEIWSELDKGPRQTSGYSYIRDQPVVKTSDLAGVFRLGQSRQIVDWMVKTDGPWIELAQLDRTNLKKRLGKASKGFGGRDECSIEVPFDIIPTAKARQKFIDGDLAPVTQPVVAYLNGAVCAQIDVQIVYKECDAEDVRARAQELQDAAPPPQCTFIVNAAQPVFTVGDLGTMDNPAQHGDVASVHLTLDLWLTMDSVHLYPDCCCDFYRHGTATLYADITWLDGIDGSQAAAEALAAEIQDYFENDADCAQSLKDLLTRGLPVCRRSLACPIPAPTHIGEFDLGALIQGAKAQAWPDGIYIQAQPAPGGRPSEGERKESTCGPFADFWVAEELQRANFWANAVAIMIEDVKADLGFKGQSWADATSLAYMTMAGTFMMGYKSWPGSDTWTTRDGSTWIPGDVCISEGCRNTFTVCGRCISWAQLGNIVYGIVGQRLGFRRETLHKAAKLTKLNPFGDLPQEDINAYDFGIRFARWTNYNETNVNVLKDHLCRLLYEADNDGESVVDPSHRNCTQCRAGFVPGRRAMSGFFNETELTVAANIQPTEDTKKAFTEIAQKWGARDKQVNIFRP